MGGVPDGRGGANGGGVFGVEGVAAPVASAAAYDAFLGVGAAVRVGCGSKSKVQGPKSKGQSPGSKGFLIFDF